MEQKPASMKDALINCKKTYSRIGNISSFLDSSEKDLDLSITKWNRYYEELRENRLEDSLRKYVTQDFPFVYPQLTASCNLNKNQVFLEIGCGPMFLASQLADKVKLVIGVDFSLKALLQAEKLMKKMGIENYLLIHGDIKFLPLVDSCVDLIYGGGVLEHFKDTSKAVSEMHRVLKPGGVAFNTVPHLNLGSLTYRQIWGNIPNFPGLRQLAEFIHIKVLKSKHMKFGYEFSFTMSTLRKLHEEAGFKKVVVDHFKTRLVFANIINPIMRGAALWVAENVSMFKPMLKVTATK